MLNMAKSRTAEDNDETYLCLILMLHSWCIAPQRADAIMARLAGWHIHREPSNTLIRYTWWGIAQRADIFSSSSIPPLFPAGRLIGFAGTRYRGLVSSSIFHPHIYFTLHWLASGTENCLICSSKFGGEGAQMLVVWGQRVPLGACSCRSPPPESCHTQRLPMPITPYLANNPRPPAPSNHRHCLCRNLS